MPHLYRPAWPANLAGKNDRTTRDPALFRSRVLSALHITLRVLRKHESVSKVSPSMSLPISNGHLILHRPFSFEERRGERERERAKRRQSATVILFIRLCAPSPPRQQSMPSSFSRCNPNVPQVLGSNRNSKTKGK